MTNDTAVGVPGGEAGRPREIPARGWWQILRRAWAELERGVGRRLTDPPGGPHP